MKFNRFKKKIKKTMQKIGLIKKFSFLSFIKKRLTSSRVGPVRKFVLVGFVLILVVISAYFLFFSSNEVLAEWWDTNWHYRKAITITNGGSAQTDFQVLIDDIDTSDTSKFLGSCQDIRFTSVNGESIDYWIESGCGTASTDIWIKVSSVPAGTSTIYMYYGNPNVSAVQSGTNTFEFFDDFDGSAVDTSKWSVYVGSPTVASSLVSFDSSTDSGIKSLNTSWLGNGSYSLETRQRVVSGSNTFNFGVSDGFDGGEPNSDDEDLQLCLTCGNIEWRFRDYNEVNYCSLTKDTENVWRITKIAYINGTSALAKNLADTRSSETKTCFTSTNLPTMTGFNTIHFRSASKTADVDWIFVRKYVSTEPTVAMQSEEKGLGPVGCWSFDEGYGTTAKDRTSNNNDGTIVGATWQTEDMCVSGKCLWFDGSDDKVSVGTSGFDSNQGSVSLWFKPNSGLINNTMIFGHQAVNNRLYIGSSSWPRIKLGIADSGGIDSSQDISYNEWQHIVLTYDSGSYSFYYNGEEVKSSSYSGSITFLSTAEIGDAGGSGWYNNFNGFIDEVNIYPYARTASQIMADYNARAGSIGTSARLSNQQSAINNLSSGLVGYWKMDEASGTSVADASGNGNTGTATDADPTDVTCLDGDTPPPVASGKYANSRDFDGCDDYVDLGNPTGLQVKSNFTLSAWIKPSSYSNNPSALGRYWAYDNLGIRTDNQALLFQLEIGGSAYVYTNYSATLGTWYLMTATYDGANVKFYVNGEEKYNQSASGTSDYYLDGWDIGRGGKNQNYFDGSIDEVRVYNRALSEREVQQLYEWAPGPVGHWKMDEKVLGNSQTLYDISGNENNGTTYYGANTTGMDCTKLGKYGGGCEFDGVDDYVNCGTGASMNITKAITIEAWVKLPAITTGVFTIISKGNGTTTNYWIDIRDSGTIYFGGYTPEGEGCYENVSGKITEANKWYHIVGTYDKIRSKIYVDGQVVRDVAKTCALTTNANHLSIGARLTSNVWNGLIDDVRIYNYARTQKQILEDMSARGGSALGGNAAVAYYKFDEGYGTSAKDSSIHGNNGTITGADWTNEGKFGKALSFNGTSDYVDCGDDDELNMEDKDFTLGAWINPISYDSNWRLFWGGNVGAAGLGLKTSSGYLRFTKLSISDAPSSNTQVSLDTWSHVAAVFDSHSSSNNLKYYLNGVNVATVTYDVDFDTNAATKHIGRGTTTNFFDGLIDEVKIFNYALTDEEIKQEYNQGKVSVMGVVGGDGSGSTSLAGTAEYCVPGSSDSCDPPVAEWNFDEKTGDYAYDTSGNGNTGTLTNMEVVDWKSAGECHSGACLDFDGSNEYVDIPAAIDNGTEISFSAWVYVDLPSNSDKPGEQHIIQLGDSTGNPRTMVSVRDVDLDDTDVAFSIYSHDGTSGGNTVSDEIYPINNWYYVMATKNGTNEKIYVNGSLVKTTSYGADDSVGNKSGAIGRAGDNTSYLSGKIDQVRIYDYARTPAQIAWDYNKGKPVAHWRFDEGQGTTLYDESDNNNDGALELGSLGQTSAGSVKVSGATAWYNGREGKQNYSLNFDGSDDYVSVGNPSSLQIIGNMSISLWFKTDGSFSTQKGLVVKDSYPVAQRSYFFLVQPTSIAFAIHRSNVQYMAQTNNEYDDSQWHHIAAVNNGTDLIIYVDGVDDTTGGTGKGGAIDNSNASITIGKWRSTEIFDGQIDEVKIFNYALSPLQIKTEYNLGAARLGTGD